MTMTKPPFPSPALPLPSALLTEHRSRRSGSRNRTAADHDHDRQDDDCCSDDDDEEALLLHRLNDVLGSLSGLDDLPPANLRSRPHERSRRRQSSRRRRRPSEGGEDGSGGDGDGEGGEDPGGATSRATGTTRIGTTADYVASALLCDVVDPGDKSGEMPAAAAPDNNEVDGDGEDGDDDDGATEREWAAGLELLRSLLLLELPGSVRPQERRRSREDKDRQQRQSEGRETPSVPPHLLLRTVLDHSLDLGIEPRRPRRRQQQRQPSTMAILLVVLGGISLRTASNETRSALLSASGASDGGDTNAVTKEKEEGKGKGEKVRWGRLASMLMECVELYQRAVLRPSLLSFDGGIEAAARTREGAVEAAALLGRCLIPAASPLLQTLEVGGSRMMDPSATATAARMKLKLKIEAIEAGIISSVTKVVRMLNSVCPANATAVGTSGNAETATSTSSSLSEEMVEGDLTVELLQSVLTLLPTFGGNADAIFVHPVRCWEYVGARRKKKRRRRRVSAQATEGDYDEDYSDDGEEDEDEGSTNFTALVCGVGNSSARRMDLCGMETTWDAAGVAYLAYRALSLRWNELANDRDGCCSASAPPPLTLPSASSLSLSAPTTSRRATKMEMELIPYVHSPRYIFAMLYPHVETLLALGQEVDNDEVGDSDSDDADDDGDDEYGCSSGNNAARKRAAAALAAAMHTRAGIDMLRVVLLTVPPSSPLLSTYAGLGDSGRSESCFTGVPMARDVKGPLGPVKCVQLLLNLAVSLSSSSSSLSSSSSVNDIQARSAKLLSPSKGEILSLIRKLLDWFLPEQRVRSVAKLLERCPYPFLEPVLLDLLRPALAIHRQSSAPAVVVVGDNGGGPANGGRGADAERIATTHQQEVDDGTLRILRPYLERMGRHVVSITRQPAPPGGGGKAPSSSSEDDGVLLSDLDGLVDSVEPYACAASLVRLLCLRSSHRRPSCEDASVSPAAVVKGTGNSSGGWNSSTVVAGGTSAAPPTGFDLDDAVDVIIDLHRGLTSRLEVWHGQSGAVGGAVASSADDSKGDSEVPSDYYRLYLLEDALAEVVRTRRESC